jgi:hypothetical protein
MLSFKTMTVSKLKELKRQVEAAIHAKVTERRHEIESELSKLSRLDSNRRAKTVRAGARGMVVLKASKRLDKSLITDSPKAPTPKRSKKTGTARKKSRKAENIGQARLLTPAGAEHIEALPIEPPSAASISANDIPVDFGAAA